MTNVGLCNDNVHGTLREKSKDYLKTY